jgi:ABC-2 type transport system ATP-binding protein
MPYGEARKRSDEVLAMVGLKDRTDVPVGTFSRGMKQRLGIADVLIKRPKLVFLDEPTSGLDPEGINRLLDLIANLPKMGTTVVLSSHQLYQVQRVCHNIGILSKGKMVIQGDIKSLGRDALAGGRYIIEVETSQPSPQLIDVVKAIKGVLSVDTEENTLVVTTESDLRPDLAKAVVQKNFPLIQMRIQEFSLDDIYMKYFKES